MPADDLAHATEDVLDAQKASQVDPPGAPVPSNPGE
jgi:hypothetical protein